MAETWFTPKEWKARLVEFAGRRLLRNVANGEATTYDVSRSEGQVSQEGDAFNTKNMNDLEQRISNGFANAKTNIDVLNRDLNAINDSGAIKGMDAREDGVYITYSTGADTVTKKLGDIITREVTGHCGNFHPNYPERSILIDIPAISGYEYFDCAIKECYFENSNGAQKSIRFKIEKYGASKIRVFPGKDSVWTSGGVSATATVMIFYK